MRPSILALALLLLPLPLDAQRANFQRDSQAVADVASRYMSATWGRDYAGAAKLVDPAHVLPLRAAMLREVEEQAESERRFRAMRDSMEAELAKARTRADTQRVMRKRESSHSFVSVDSGTPLTRVIRPTGIDTALVRLHGAKVLTALRGKPTVSALLAMPDTAFLGIVLAGNQDYLWEKFARDDPRVAEIDRSPTRPEDMPRIHVVDVVIERDSVAHVLLRPLLPGGDEMFDWGGEDDLGPMSTVLLQLRRRPGGWRVRLGDQERRQFDNAISMSRAWPDPTRPRGERPK